MAAELGISAACIAVLLAAILGGAAMMPLRWLRPSKA